MVLSDGWEEPARPRLKVGRKVALAGCLGRILRSQGPVVASPYEVLGDEIILGMIIMWHGSLILS